MKTFRAFGLVPGLSCLLAWVFSMPVMAQVSVVGASAGSVPQLAFRQAEIARVWNAGRFAQAATTAGSKGAISYSSSDAAVATVQAATGLVTPLRQGLVTITATQAPQGFFPAAQASYRVRLAAGAPVLQPWTLPVVSLVSGPVTLVPPGSDSPGVFSFASSNPAVAHIEGRQLTVLGSGEALITATQAPTDDYTGATASARLVVNLLTPTLGALQLPTDLVFGGPARTLVAPASDSPAPFAYTSSQPQVVQVVGNQLQVVGAGSAVITATQAAQGVHAGASVSAVLQVAKAAPALNDPVGAVLLESRWQSAAIPMLFGLTSAQMGVSGGAWSVVGGEGVESFATSFSGHLVIRTAGPGAITVRYTVPETANTLSAYRDVRLFAYANQPFRLADASVERPPSLPDGTVIGSVGSVVETPTVTTVGLNVCVDRITTYRFRFAVSNGEPFGVGWSQPVATGLIPSGGEVVVNIPLGGSPGDLSSRPLWVRQQGSADGLHRDVTRHIQLDITPVVCPGAPV